MNKLDDYYRNCPFSKSTGEPKRKKKKQNGYKDKPNRRCVYTGKPGAERHEIFSGIFRQTSIDMGFQIDVCPDIHYALQYETTDWAKKEALRWKRYFQKKYEAEVIKNGLDKIRARGMWIQLVGKNYIEEGEANNE